MKLQAITFGMTQKELQRYMQAEGKRYGTKFEELPPAPGGRRPLPTLVRAVRNRDFLVQVYANEHPLVLARLSINRAYVDRSGQWLDGITWDQLQAIKNQLGYAGHDAVEVFPREGKLVNVANLRHLWVLHEPLAFAWGAEG